MALPPLNKLRSLTDDELADALRRVPGNRSLPRRPVPVAPILAPKTSMRDKLKEIQKFISAFEYNHTGTHIETSEKLDATNQSRA